MTADEILPVAEAIIVKMMPLYAVMGLGYVYGKMERRAAEPLSYLQIYFVAPLVIASSLANMNFERNYLLLPVITFIAGSFVSLLTLWIGKRFWRGSTANIFSYACGTGNTGYYGVPVALILFPPEIIGLFMMAAVGFTLFENSLGYYLVARGNFTVGDSLRKLSRLPTLYAFVVGVLLSMLGQHVPPVLQDLSRDFRGCYVVLGALMIGLGLSRLEHFKIDVGLTGFVFTMKFVFWPLLVFTLIRVDRSATHLFAAEVHKILILLAIVPLPANAIAFAMQLNVQPDKASTLVFLSTVFALFYIPVFMAVWG